MTTTAKFPAATLALADVGADVPNIKTAVLSGSHNASVTTITLTATVPTEWPTQDWVVIDTEVILYTGKSGSTLTGCTRGTQTAYGAGVAATHNDQAVVAPYLTAQQVNQIVAELIAVETYFAPGGAVATIASAATTDLSTVAKQYMQVTGTTTITAFGTLLQGEVKILEFAGALTLTHNSTSLILRSGANAVTAAGDIYAFVSEGAGNWRELWHNSVNFATNAVAGDVTITTAGTFYDGPTVTLGPGTWVLNGNVTVRDTVGSLFFTAKLWDGTTVYTSTEAPNLAANAPTPLPLSWVVTLTAASTTIKISVTSTGSTNGRILAAVPNSGAGNNASWLTAHRIA